MDEPTVEFEVGISDTVLTGEQATVIAEIAEQNSAAIETLMETIANNPDKELEATVETIDREAEISTDQSEQNVAPEETDVTPDWLAQGNDPPGGEIEMRQSFSVLFQQDGMDPQTGVMKVRGTATTANVINTKRQVYPLVVWQDNIPRMKRMIDQGRLLGEIEHPLDGRRSLDRTCLQFTDVYLQDNEVKFAARIIPTDPHGQNLIRLIQAGIPVDISSRGYGTFIRQSWQDIPDVNVVQRGFRCDGFDAVIAGASPNSTISDWEMAQSSQTSDSNTEDEMDLEQIKAQLAEMAAANAALAQELELVKNKPVEQSAEQKDEITRQRARDAQIERILVSQSVESLVAQNASDLPTQWQNMYRRLLQNSQAVTLDGLNAYAETALKLVQDTMAAAPRFPGNGFTVQKDKGSRGPSTARELIEELVSDLPDDVPSATGVRQSEEAEHGVPDSIRSPRRQVRRILQNIATHQSAAWNGPAAIQGLLALERGHGPEQVQNILDQACTDGTTAVGAGGAPVSSIFIFPLVRRVYPQLIASELASIQPMDRPDGKIFFLDNYRVSTGIDTVDEGGATVSNRLRMDRSDSFSDSYSDDPGECNVSNLLQLRLSSRSVQAETKKLHAIWSIEELQDLRAYHGLDVSSELVGSLSREIALEWNQIMLQEMLDGATAGNVTFGTTAASGYTQKEWDEYITRYIDKASTNIFKKRHGDATHIIAGPDAWLKLGAAFRVGVNPRSGMNPDQFAGLTLTPFMTGTSASLNAYKTSFWTGVNSNKILVIRRGTDWSDTPYVWAPYIDYVSPTLTLPDVFTQKAGVMSRAAHKVVVGDAMSVITISAVGGTPL